MIIIFSTEQKILSLKVSMTNLLQMEILHNLDHLPEDVLGLFLRKFTHFIQSVEKLAAFAETK